MSWGPTGGQFCSCEFSQTKNTLQKKRFLNELIACIWLTQMHYSAMKLGNVQAYLFLVTVSWTIQDEALFIHYTLQRMTHLTQPILVLSAYPTPTCKCQHASHDSHILINLLKYY